MKLHKLTEGPAFGYTTWGCMWEKGTCGEETAYLCKNEAGQIVPMQSRITAYWQDGSVKWTAHTADAGMLGEEIEVLPQKDSLKILNGITVEDAGQCFVIHGGRLKLEIPKEGGYLFTSLEFDGKICAFSCRPELLLEEPVRIDGNPAKMEKKYQGKIESVEFEEWGPLQCIVKFTGTHQRENGECKMPFIIRMRIGKDSHRLHFMHTFFYDGDEEKDYLKGLGIVFDFPLSGAPYNRHIKAAGDHGVFHESVLPLTSWRPRVPAGLYERQMRGECLALEGEEGRVAEQIMQNAPFWSAYDICQDSASHFAIRKKLQPDHCCYIDALHGNRAKGSIAVGSEGGCVLMGIRDFWEKYPSGITVRGLDGERAQCCMWFWSPAAPAMDFRHYADRGYNQVCYEGYDYKGADPDGIACTNECAIAFSQEMIVSDGELLDFAREENNPALYVGTPEFYHGMRAFGYWSLPERNTEMECWMEDQLEKAFLFYQNEVEQRGWYGMFNYGDFMHTYDGVRHQWKYDMGGYAWDNTELVPTLWLWLYFMRTGRRDVFRLAEKLSRHASEVDVYHFGRYKGLGSRHNVRHWGCPCKEARIAMAAHHRFYYYLTGDRRFEDIFEELKDNELSFLNKDPLGDFYDKADMVYPSHARSGPDWSSLCSNWMTRWERFHDTAYRDKIQAGIEDIKKAPLKLVSGPDFEFDPKTCHLRYIGERTKGGCHLQICMGAPSVWMELADLLEDEEWKEMLAQYGRFYYLPREKQLEESGGLIGDREFSLPFMAAAMGAYGAAYLKDDELAMRTWRILLHAQIHEDNHEGFLSVVSQNQGNHESLREIPWISTNFVAQFCLNAIMVLEFIREKLPATMDEAQKLVAGMDAGLFRKA